MPKLILACHGVEDDKRGPSQWIEYGKRRYDLRELSVPQELFEKQLTYLRHQGYQSVSLKDFLLNYQKKLELPKKSVAITFDDGFENLFKVARPLLKKYGYQATIFLITDKINSNYFLSWQEIFEMKKQGFSFGVHTLSHPVLTSLGLAEAKREIEQSKKIIEEKLNQPVEFFSYPYGEFNSDIQNIIKQAGFLGAVVTPQGPGIKEGPYSLKRIGINRNNSMITFKFKVKSYFSWLRERKFLWKILIKIKK